MIDHTQRHQAQIEKERRELLLAGATIEQWKQGRWPAGSIWLWALGVAGPKGSAPREELRKDLQ
jgi:hypothetical protein